MLANSRCDLIRGLKG